MYSFSRMLHNKPGLYKKTGLKVITCFLATMILPTYLFAGKAAFKERRPLESERCSKIDVTRIQVKNLDTGYINNLVRLGCYSSLYSLLETKNQTERTKRTEAIRIIKGSCSRQKLISYLELAVENIKDHPHSEAYWDIFDLLLNHIDITRQSTFERLLQNQDIMENLGSRERLYIAARFLSGKNTIATLMEDTSSQGSDLIKLNLAEKKKQLDILIPFGWPLVFWDQLSLYDHAFNNLEEEVFDRAKLLTFGENESLLPYIDDIQDSYEKIQPELEGIPFLAAHREAYQYLLQELVAEASVEKGDKSNRIRLPGNMTSIGSENKEASSLPVLYGVITMDILCAALGKGLNPNTLISGIEFDPGFAASLTSNNDHTFELRKQVNRYSLLEWAAMGNIAGTTDKKAVDMLLQAGANPQTLPQKWHNTRKKWLEKWQNKVDQLDLPYSQEQYDLHDLLPFSSRAKEAKFMQNYQRYLRGSSYVVNP